MVCFPSYGGSGVVATELGYALAAKGHEVHFVCHNRPVRWDSLRDNIFFHLVEVVSYPLFDFAPYTLALACKLFEVARQYELDLIHVHYAIPHSASAFLARKMLGSTRLKIITTLHGTDIVLVGMDPSYKSITSFSINVSQGVTAVSEYLARATKEKFSVDGEIKVIPNFVDPDHFCKRDAPRFRSHYASAHEKIICYTSNFRPIKRASDVIRIFKLIADKLPVKLLMIGNGPDHGTCQEMVVKYGLRDKVHFLDFVDDVGKVLSISDLFLFPSELESFGLAALEAMSSELPVVAAKVGGLPEVIQHGESGYLEKFGDLDAMADRVYEILSDPTKAGEMGRTGRRRVVEKFALNDIIGLYEDYYFSVLDN
jgi:N-acetyl-alpha-D-glucosaminyl L-malate synthase BshA